MDWWFRLSVTISMDLVTLIAVRSWEFISDVWIANFDVILDFIVFKENFMLILRSFIFKKFVFHIKSFIITIVFIGRVFLEWSCFSLSCALPILILKWGIFRRIHLSFFSTNILILKVRFKFKFNDCQKLFRN